MPDSGRILMADDEPTFLSATADLLRREGYEVDGAPDADTALDLIGRNEYDLVISDLQMPGNENLRLVREVAVRAGGLPIILITGFPSAESAIASIGLPVAAYMLKPVRFDELLANVRTTVARFRSWRTMRRTEERLGQWQHEMHQFSQAGQGLAPNATSIDAFLALTLRNVMGSLTDLTALSQALNHQGGEKPPQVCQVMNCPRGSQLQAAIQETIDVLEETKSSFKSKSLATLRQKLELLMAHG